MMDANGSRPRGRAEHHGYSTGCGRVPMRATVANVLVIRQPAPAGEHTSEPQEAVAGVGETAVGMPLPAALLQAQLHQQPALSLTAPVPRARGGFELASSPPASASPMYRANSVVSHTAGAALGGGRMQQPGARRGAETPASAPAAPPPGSSPPNSRGEVWTCP